MLIAHGIMFGCCVCQPECHDFNGKFMKTKYGTSAICRWSAV